MKKLHSIEKKFAKIVKKGIKALSESDTAKMEKYRAKYLEILYQGIRSSSLSSGL